MHIKMLDRNHGLWNYINLFIMNNSQLVKYKTEQYILEKIVLEYLLMNYLDHGSGKFVISICGKIDNFYIGLLLQHCKN